MARWVNNVINLCGSPSLFHQPYSASASDTSFVSVFYCLRSTCQGVWRYQLLFRVSQHHWRWQVQSWNYLKEYNRKRPYHSSVYCCIWSRYCIHSYEWPRKWKERRLFAGCAGSTACSYRYALSLLRSPLFFTLAAQLPNVLLVIWLQIWGITKETEHFGFSKSGSLPATRKCILLFLIILNIDVFKYDGMILSSNTNNVVPSGRTVWGVGVVRLDAETVRSNLA
jgi:hypothetical protein